MVAVDVMATSDPPRSLERIANPTVQQVVDGMVKFALRDSTTEFVLNLRNAICNGLASGDYAGEALACYYWVHQNIRYVRDPQTAEYVRDSKRLVEAGAGDCDDMSVLLAALLIACGNKVSFALVTFRGAPQPSHVFVMLHTPKGFVPMDPVAGRLTADMLRRAARVDLVSVNAGKAADSAWGAAELPQDRRPVQPAMTVYSVYDYDRGMFRYFEAPGEVPPVAWFRGPSRKALTPEEIAVQLPAGARDTGEEGERAAGIIATRMSGVGALTVAGNGIPARTEPLGVTAAFLVGLGLGYYLWKGGK